MSTSIVYPAIATFAITAILVHLFRNPAEKMGLLDVPGGRKRHDRAIPLVGGIAIFFAFCFVLLLTELSLTGFNSLIAGMAILIVTGILDDFQDISAASKLVAQVVAALIMASWGGVVVTSLGDLFGSGEVLLGGWSIPFTVLCTVGIINAINMLDGMDGLGGGVSVVILAWLAIGAMIGGMTVAASVLILLISAVCGFLLFNFRHRWRICATVFLGDAGSMVLGFAMAWFAVYLTQGEGAALEPITVAWILALPTIDTLVLMARRMIKRRSPLSADREHIHHILLRAGFSHGATVNILILSATLFGAVGLIAIQLELPASIMLLTLIVLFSGHLYFVMHAWNAMKAIKRLRRWREIRS